MHESRLANLLGATVLTLSDRMTAAAAEAAGASLSGTAALVVLSEFPGLGGTELGHRIGLSQPACARMLDQLAARGLVERQARQGRAVAVVLTKDGRAAAKRALAARQEVLAGALRAVPDRAALEPVLEQLLRRLHAEVRDGDLMCRLCDRPGCVAQRRSCPVGEAGRS
ncbi:MarR family winged helix-turn-helix transcriptional regulator [Amycolatopsis australiensis]|uniref:DNA-binding transcriptional regulator, MarR family n=1 Tax=Amycolatopsis australiensis TaxID=546364 RepID=A0A1K1R9L4_9PSEU|nr:MarR family winged helix-turn-helix transcriptional regulator [Amycolatopsis australiensis]SFW68733.1 DNA-binding transcriptional regulator, MarR family [Amycolatopsis australiensis]